MPIENQKDQTFPIFNRRADSHIKLNDQINNSVDDDDEEINSSKR